MKKNQLEFTYMRGIAIIWIVLGHSIYNSGQGFPLMLENLLRGGTALFVFISGYFFHRIFYKKFDLKTFMKSKVRNVLYPFLIVSLVGLLLLCLRWVLMDGHDLEKVLMGIYYTSRNGYVLYPHWYIPFIMLVFLCSPLFIRYIQCSTDMRWTLFILSCVIAALIHRPIGNINVVHSVVYFTPFYLLGILYSTDEARIARYTNVATVLAFVGLIITLVMQTYVEGHVGNYHKFPFTYGGIDWQFLQKLCLCLLVLDLSVRLSKMGEIDWLIRIAEMSFAIFFIHPIFSFFFGIITQLLRYKLPPDNVVTTLLFSAFIFLFLMVGSIVTANFIKARLGDRSRTYIGW